MFDVADLYDMQDEMQMRYEFARDMAIAVREHELIVEYTDTAQAGDALPLDAPLYLLEAVAIGFGGEAWI